MSKEILTKAIEKAIANRFDMGDYSLNDVGWLFHDDVEGGYVALPDDCIKAVIFSHSFAKALWGEKFINPEMRDDTGGKVIALQKTAWKHHLRQMVIAPDPIKYLGDNC